MQTKQQIEQLLAMAGVRPNKRLGQHFLIDLNIIKLFVDHCKITKNDIVLEVGPGTGSLTEELVERAGFLVAVEYDKVLANILTKRLGSKENIKIINSDILKNQNAICQQAIDAVNQARQQFSGKFILAANLPYDISSPLMINLITGSLCADEMFVTVQKEVALRMTAACNDPLYGSLGIFMGAAGAAKIFHKLGTLVFYPPPAVESAMVEFVRDKDKIGNIHNMKVFKDVVGLFMQHRRKMLRACTKYAPDYLSDKADWEAVFSASQIEPTNRPENLSPTDFVNLSNSLSKQL